MGSAPRERVLVEPRYFPAEGDLIWVDLSPQAGREQAGRRPALVLSPVAYNRATGLLVCCPITSRAKGYPFEVPIRSAAASTAFISGVALTDHVRSIDWHEREAEYAGVASAEALEQVRRLLPALLGIADPVH